MNGYLLSQIDARIKDISEQMHRLKREHEALKQARMPLSMGVVSESEIAARLYAQGITIYQEAL